MKDKTRNVQMDILRGIGIILVVLGHSGFPATHFVYLFHLAIFFIVSGYFFKEEHVKNSESLKKFIKNKIKRLYLPFIIGNVICILWNNVFIDMNLYSISTHKYYSLKDIVINIVKILLFRGTTEMLGATWFLQILFLITIGYACVEFILNKFNVKYKSLIQLIISIVFLLSGYYFSTKGIDLKIINVQALTCYILFDFGRKISKYKIQTKDSTKMVIMISSFILLVILNGLGTIELSQHEYTNPIYFIIVSIIGWYFIYELSYFVSKAKVMTYIFRYIGKNTMPILIFHFIAFKLVNGILVLIFKEDITLISRFPILLKDSWWWVIYTLIGILISLGLNEVKRHTVKFVESKREEGRYV